MKKENQGAPLKAVSSYREPFPPAEEKQAFVGPYFPPWDEELHCRACQSQRVTSHACPDCPEWARLTTKAGEDALAAGVRGASVFYFPHYKEHVHVVCAVCKAVSLYATRHHAKKREEAEANFRQAKSRRLFRWVCALVGLACALAVTFAVVDALVRQR